MTAPEPGPVPDSVTAAAVQHAASVAATAEPYEPPTAPDGAVVDDSPALDGVLPEQTVTDEDDGVDRSTMPEFRSLKGQLPAARFHVKRQLAELEKILPEALKNADGDMPEEQVVDSIGEIDEMFQKIQDLVLDRAADREAMTAWLIAQESGENSPMAAFSKMSDDLGN
mgnify:CR=1 FL=1